MRIPKIIHQTWKNKDIPYDIYQRDWVESWKKYHPDWEYRLWTDEDNRNLIKNHYPDFLEVYDSYDKGINRADAARYFILHHCGGLYVDLDFECLKNFEPVLEGYDLVLGRMDTGLLVRHSLPNALMASSKNNPFWLNIINELKKPYRYKNHYVEMATGPALLASTFVRYQICRWFKGLWGSKDEQRIRVYAPVYFFPISWTKQSVYRQTFDRSARGSYPYSYAITYWCHYW